LTPYPENVIDHCATFVGEDNDRFYVLGGYNEDSKFLSDSVMEYDFSTGKYEIVTTIKNGGLGALGCTGFQNNNGDRYLVIVGGYIDIGKPTGRFLLFDFQKDQWTELSSYPESQANFI
jgi:hypothetical protein